MSFTKDEMAEALAIIFSMPTKAYEFMKLSEPTLTKLFATHLDNAKALAGQAELTANQDKLEKQNTQLINRVEKQQKMIEDLNAKLRRKKYVEI